MTSRDLKYKALHARYAMLIKLLNLDLGMQNAYFSHIL